MAKTEITIPHVVEKFISQLRERKGFKTTAETVEYMLPIAASRINATTKYARDQKPEPKPKKAKAAKPAKKAPAKKSAPKGPLARKVASKAKAPVRRKAKSAAAQIGEALVTERAAAETKPAEAAAPVLD
jgi:hypothetical protein